MKNLTKVKTIGLSLATILALGFSGCGSSSSNNNNDDDGDGDLGNTISMSGLVADGYLDKAKVCLDKNTNGKCDTNEPNALSSDGNFTFDINATDSGKYPVVVEVLTTTKDLDDGNFVTNGYTLTAPKDSTSFISPITTLVQNEIEKCPALTKAEATARISTKLNLTSTDTKLLTDYVANDSDSESKKIHEVGKVVAKLQGELEQKITQSGVSITDSNKKAVVKQIWNNIYSDINNTSALIDSGTLASAIDTTSKVTNTNISSNDISLEIKNIDLIKTNKTVQMQDMLSEPFFTFKHGKVDGVKLNDGKFYVGNSTIASGSAGVDTISPNMFQAETYTVLSDGSLKLSNNSTTTFKRVSKLDANTKIFTLKEILTMMTEDNIPMYKKLEKDGVVISQAKYDTQITFSSGDYMYLLILEQHNNGTFIDITYNFNDSAMKKIVEVLK